MRFTTKTEYGLVCLIYMAKQGEGKIDTVTIKQLVSAEQFPEAYTEKILQSLRAAGIVESHQGHHGGYALARPAAQIKLKEIIEALEGQTFEVFCAPDVRTEITCTHFPLCGVKPLWEKTKTLLDRFYDHITLEMLSKNELETLEVA